MTSNFATGDQELSPKQDCQLSADVSCSQCRLTAAQGVLLLSPAHLDPDQSQECEWGDDMRESFAFVASAPTVLPEWIRERLELTNWTKGKLYCQKCQLHIGSFNFTNEMKCLHCRQTFGSSLYFLCGNVSITYCNINNNSLNSLGASTGTTSSSCSQPIPCPSSLAGTASSSGGFFHPSHNPSFVNQNVSPLHDPFHPESPTISTLNLATADADTFDQNYDRICAELSLIIDPLHPDNLRISSEGALPPHALRPVRSSPNSLVSMGSNDTDAVADETGEIMLSSRFLADFDSDHLTSPELSSIRSCFPTSDLKVGSSHQRRHSISMSNFETNMRTLNDEQSTTQQQTIGNHSTGINTGSFFVSTHETNLSQINRRLRRNADWTFSASNSPSSLRRPLGHPRMLASADMAPRGATVIRSTSAATCSNESPSSSDEEFYWTDLAREHQCPICLDIMYYPVSCKPCHHKFCGFCLKTQACESVATTTKCAVCRSYIHHVVELTDLAAKLKECFSKAYRKRSKQMQTRGSSTFATTTVVGGSSGGGPSVGVGNLDSLPFPGFHAGKNSYQICCCIAYIHASKHRKKYMAILQALLYFVVIGLPIFTLIIATVFSQ